MSLVWVRPDEIGILNDLARTGHAKQFEARLTASIRAMGLAEPLKIAKVPATHSGLGTRYVVVDGVMRFRAILALRSEGTRPFEKVPAYVVDFNRRHEIRFQTDVYQDLLPSQFAQLVEFLHKQEAVSKSDIAQYIGVSAATLRNYTGLWRLVQRGGLFSRIVELMDAGALPASNPFAWLRLNEHGLRFAIEAEIAKEMPAEAWIERTLSETRRGSFKPVPLKYVEAVTGLLPDDCYRETSETRAMKQELGLRKSPQRDGRRGIRSTLAHLEGVAAASRNPVLAEAASSLREYLK